MADNLTGKLRVLQQAFITADKDGDSLLNRQEFEEFVAIGYQKSLPNGIYENLCHHFNRDPNIGVDWNTARTVFIQAQRRPSSNTSQESSQEFLKQAFIQCDKDGDSLLNKAEFHEMIKVGFNKPSCPPGMYEQVCAHFKKNPDIGIDWLTIYSLWKQ
eukprot:223439_1